MAAVLPLLGSLPGARRDASSRGSVSTRTQEPEESQNNGEANEAERHIVRALSNTNKPATRGTPVAASTTPREAAGGKPFLYNEAGERDNPEKRVPLPFLRKAHFTGRRRVQLPQRLSLRWPSSPLAAIQEWASHEFRADLVCRRSRTQGRRERYLAKLVTSPIPVGEATGEKVQKNWQGLACISRVASQTVEFL